MVKEHAINTMIVSADKKVLVDFLGEVTKDYKTLKDFYSELQSFKDGALDDDDILDIISDIHLVSDVSFAKLSELHLCMNEGINIYFRRTAEVFANLAEKLKVITSSFCAPNAAETEELMDMVYRVISGICFILWNEFGCYSTAESVAEGKEPVFDEILYNHFAKFTVVQEQRHEMCINFANDVVETTHKFRIKLDVFDAAPEKEDEFMALVGPDIGMIDETKLTMELVDKVLDGSMQVEELVELCRYVEDDSDDGELVTVSPSGSTTVSPAKMEF